MDVSRNHWLDSTITFAIKAKDAALMAQTFAVSPIDRANLQLIIDALINAIHISQEEKL